MVGYILIIISLFTNGFFFVFEQWLMKKYYLEPMEIVGFEGMFGFLVYIGIVALLSHLPCSFGKNACVYTSEGLPYMEGWTVFWHTFTSNTFILILTLFSVSSIMVYNVAGVTITKYINSLARAIADVTKTILVWVISILVTVQYGKEYPNYKWEVLETLIIVLQIVGFVFLVMGNLVYNEIVKLPRVLRAKEVEPEKERLVEEEGEKE